MDGITTQTFFIRVLAHPPTNPGDMAEVAELFRLCVQDMVYVATLHAHTTGVSKEVEMEQSTSKHAREDDDDDVAYDTLDTGASWLHP